MVNKEKELKEKNKQDWKSI